MLCGGHVGHSPANNFKDYKSKKSVDQSFIAMYAKNYPQLASAKCECVGKKNVVVPQITLLDGPKATISRP